MKYLINYTSEKQFQKKHTISIISSKCISYLLKCINISLNMFKGTSLENSCLEKRTKPRKIVKETETKVPL